MDVWTFVPSHRIGKEPKRNSHLNHAFSYASPRVTQYWCLQVIFISFMKATISSANMADNTVLWMLFRESHAAAVRVDMLRLITFR